MTPRRWAAAGGGERGGGATKLVGGPYLEKKREGSFEASSAYLGLGWGAAGREAPRWPAAAMVSGGAGTWGGGRVAMEVACGVRQRGEGPI